MARRRKEEDASVQAQAEIEAMMTMVENRTQETLIQAETLLQEVRMDLEDSNVRAANRELNKAEGMLEDINRQVFGLRRNTAMFNRLMSDRRTTEDELMRVLRGMRDVASHAENGHINAAAAGDRGDRGGVDRCGHALRESLPVPNVLDGDRDAMASRRGLWCSDRGTSERWGQTPATDAVGTPIANLLVC